MISRLRENAGFGRGRQVFSAVLIGLALALAGCDGDDGATGPQGDPGPQGPPGPPGGSLPTVAEAETIIAEITDVAVDSPPVVEFRLMDERGQGLIGLPASSIRFTVAKLVPGTDGNASAWQSYINRIAEAGEGPHTEDEVQATREAATPDRLVDNGDGSYQYTFETDITNVTDPIAVDYEDKLTHRVGLEIRGFVPVDNPTYDFVPAGGGVQSTRKIVETDTCNNCHDRLAEHGNGRFETDYCMTCHNPGSTDAYSGNTVDFKVMVHKIHRGANLPSVQAGGSYVIEGTDFSHVVFPQDIRNCRNCHNEDNAATPDAINWIAQPTMEACGSCHDNVNFATGENHFDGAPAVSNADCQSCHGEGKFASADKVHRLLEQEAAQKYQYNIVEVTDTGPGQTPTVTFSVTNPLNNDEPYDIQNDQPFVEGGGASRLSIDIAWNTIDYSNTGGGTPPSRAVELNPLFGGSTDNGDGTFSITSGVALPADLTGTLAVGIEGHPAEDVDGEPGVERLPVTGEVDYFAVTDDTPVPRREVVAIENCNVCHQKLSLHGSNRTDKIELCVLCHNPNGTDIGRRAPAGVDASNSLDGKDEETIDFKHMIHAIHAGDIVVYGFGGNPNDYREVEFPGQLNNCENCHEEDTYYPVNQAFVLATTIDTGLDLADPLDDANISPTSSACSGCHRSATAASHMNLNGGSFNARQTSDGTLIDNDTNGIVIESCEVCHGPGRIADVAVVHGEHD